MREGTGHMWRLWVLGPQLPREPFWISAYPESSVCWEEVIFSIEHIQYSQSEARISGETDNRVTAIASSSASIIFAKKGRGSREREAKYLAPGHAGGK